MSRPKSYLVPNLVILVRVILAFLAVGLFLVPSLPAAATGVVLTVAVIAMDGLDGHLARRLDLTSDLGAVLDITADRIVEHIFWISFAVFGQVGLWVPLVVMTRSFLVDTARGMALAHGKTAFGSTTMQRSGFARFLTGSRAMRTAYAVAKTGAFVLLGVQVAVGRVPDGGAEVLPRTLLAQGAQVMVWVAVALCVVRGVPVLMDSRAYLEPAAVESGGGDGA